jgi:hypothetical protein
VISPGAGQTDQVGETAVYPQSRMALESAVGSLARTL